MSKNETKGRTVQIIHTPGGPFAFLPLRALLALRELARGEIERADAMAHARRGELNVSLNLLDEIAALAEEVEMPAAATWNGLYAMTRDSEPGELEEEAADRAAYLEAKASGGEALPLAVAKRLAAGEHPVKVFREHRGLTQAELAEAAGTKAAYLSQIETGTRDGSRKLLARLADALDVDLADLF